ncbi:MAG: type II secretion system protein N [Gammaproteobacteria bacterium]|nr:type II secretion system protein N [Gammaproteobacteria bacterium]
MKRWVGWLVLLGFAYALGLLIWLPAESAYRYARPYIEPEIERRLDLQGVDGTVWQGSAAQLYWDEMALGRLSWEVAPLQLLGGSAALQWLLQQGDGHLKGVATAALDRSGETVEMVEGDFGVGQILQLFPFLPLVLEGRVVLDLPRITLSGGKLTGAEGVVQWRQAALTVPLKAALGDLQLRLEPLTTEGREGVEGMLSNEGGELQLAGSVTFESSGRYLTQITVEPRSTTPEQLRNSLGLLGRRGQDGKYHIRRSGVIR